MSRTPRPRRPLAIVLLCALVASAPLLGTPGRAHGAPPVPADPKETPGTLTLSDGAFKRGLFYLKGAGRLTLVVGAGRPIRLKLAEIERLDQEVQNEKLEKEWVFREEGSTDKLFTGRSYPTRKYRATIKTRDGRTLTGTVRGVLYFAESAEAETEERFILRPVAQGAVGQTPGDLTYVRSLVLTHGTPPAEHPGRVTGRLKGFAAVESVLLIDRAHDRTRSAIPDARGKFGFSGLAPGAYDVVVIAAREIRFAVGGPPGRRVTTLSAAQRQSLTKAVTVELSDFFESRKVLDIEGTPERVYVTLLKERRAKTTYDKKGQRHLLRRVEYWRLHLRKGEGSWALDARTYLLRENLPADEQGRKVVVDRRCAGLTIGAASPAVAFTLDRTAAAAPPGAPESPESPAPPGAPESPKAGN